MKSYKRIMPVLILTVGLSLVGCGNTTPVPDENMSVENTETLEDSTTTAETTEETTNTTEASAKTETKDNEVTETAPKHTQKPAPEPTATPKPAAPPEPAQPPHTHDYAETITKQPTCTEDGVKTLTCACGDVKTEAIPATGHDFVTQYQTLVHEAVGHEEITTVQTGTTKRTEYECAYCGARFDTAAGVVDHCAATGDFDHAFARTIAYDYEEPVYEEVSTWVIDTPAWEEQVPVGSVCSKCGQQKE